jgi:hypothetical protein
MGQEPPLDLSLRAKRSNLQGAIAVNCEDCFVTSFLAMTPLERLYDGYLRALGSKTSRNPSPSMLKPKTVKNMASPGKVEYHQP